MMIKAYSYCLAIFALLFASCSPQKVKTPEELFGIDIIGGYNQAGKMNISELVSDVDFIQLEAVPESYFTAEQWGFSQNVSISQKHILVMAKKSRSLILFDRQGKFLRKIGRAGKGPGEFVYIETACLDPWDRFIILIDPFSDQIIKYSIDGKVLLTKHFTDYSKQWEADRIRLFTLDADHLALLLSRPKVPTDHFSQILLLNEDLNITDSLLKRANDDKLFQRGWVMPHLSASFGKLLFWENYFDTLYYLYPDGRQEPKYHLLFTKDNLPDNYFNDLTGSTGWDKLCYIDKIIDLPDHLVLLGNYNQEESFGLDFNKNTKETINIRRNGRIAFENDLYAFPIMPDFEVNYFEKTIYQVMELGPNTEKLDDKLTNQNVLLPAKRDELVKILENRTDNNNPLLILMKLKSF
jgi:hypothetical protein